MKKRSDTSKGKMKTSTISPPSVEKIVDYYCADLPSQTRSFVTSKYVIDHTKPKGERILIAGIADWESMYQTTLRLATRTFKNRSPVYHMCDGKMSGILAGHLRKTGRGFVLDRVSSPWILFKKIHYYGKYEDIEEMVQEAQDQLGLKIKALSANHKIYVIAETEGEEDKALISLLYPDSYELI